MRSTNIYLQNFIEIGSSVSEIGVEEQQQVEEYSFINELDKLSYISIIIRDDSLDHLSR